jgi:hypothetical protein
MTAKLTKNRRSFVQKQKEKVAGERPPLLLMQLIQL